MFFILECILVLMNLYAYMSHSYSIVSCSQKLKKTVCRPFVWKTQYIPDLWRYIHGYRGISRDIVVVHTQTYHPLLRIRLEESCCSVLSLLLACSVHLPPPPSSFQSARRSGPQAGLATLDATIFDSLVQNRVNLLGIELRVTKHCDDLFQLLDSPLVPVRACTRQVQKV